MKLLIVILSLLVNLTAALNFNLPATGATRCIREFVKRDELGVLKVTTNGHRGDGQKLSISIKDNKGNKYGQRDNVGEQFSQAFTAGSDVSIDVCFTNTAVGKSDRPLSREIRLSLEVGAAARDWSALQASEKLKPSELELRRADELMEEVEREFEYLQARELRLRDTNESTNERVQNFFVLSIIAFISLAAWQIYYLRCYFRSKHII